MTLMFQKGFLTAFMYGSLPREMGRRKCVYHYVSPPMFLSMNFWVVDLILGSKSHLIERKIDNTSNKLILVQATVLKQG